MSTLKHITDRNWFPILGRIPIYAEHLNKVIDVVNTLGTTGVGNPADLIPVVRTNNPAVAVDTVYKNLDHLDAAIGADNTPVSRTNNPTVANTTLNAKVQALDNAIGTDAAMVSQNYISSSFSINYNLSQLDSNLGTLAVASVFNALSASINGAGTSQGTGTAIASGIAVVGAADGTVGVVLPAVAVGESVTIFNILAAQNLKVYPATGEYINAAAQNASVKFSHATDVSSVVCTRASAAHWTMTAIHATIS